MKKQKNAGMAMLSNFSRRMQRIIINNLGWRNFTGIQKKAIPEIFAGNNVLIIAPTASGKTEAFLLPILDRVSRFSWKPTSILYISPIKALINNQYLRFLSYGRYLGITSFKWHGDVGRGKRKKYLEDPTDNLLITPESLEVILFNDHYDHRKIFKNIRAVIVDEIHAFAGDVRGVHLLSLLERIERITEHPLQRIGVSATIGNPDEMAKWLQGSSKCPVTPVIDKGERKRIVKLKYFAPDSTEMERDIVNRLKNKKSLFFSNSRSNTERLNNKIKKYPLKTYVHHSSINKHLREKAEEDFRVPDRNNSVIFCTSTLELGIDIGDLDQVLQYNPPYSVANFLQRMGRSGRKNNIAYSIIYNTKGMNLIRSIAIVNLIIKGEVEPIKFRKKAWDIYFHQVLALVHQEWKMKREDIFTALKNVYSFQKIGKEEFDYFIDYMLEFNYLSEHKGYLLMGPKAEEEFGYAHFYNFYSVFENTTQYAVIYQHQVIGSLDAFYINTRNEEDIRFLLGGRVWKIKSLDKENFKVYVRPVARGDAPFWISGPSLIERPLAEEIYRVLASDEMYHFVDKAEKKKLEEERSKYPDYEEGKIIIKQSANSLTIHSFAGDRINLTLGLFLKNELGAIKYQPCFKGIRLTFPKGDEDYMEDTIELLHDLKNREVLLSQKMLSKMADELPVKYVSKYYPYLPPLLKKEVVEELYLDVEGVLNFLRGKKFRNAGFFSLQKK